jgi:hypothetical protein
MPNFKILELLRSLSIIATSGLLFTTPGHAVALKAPHAMAFPARPGVPVVDTIDITSKCGADLKSVDSTFNVKLVAPSVAAGDGAKVLIYIWINGRSVPAATGNFYQIPNIVDNQKTGVAFTFENNFSGLGGKANVQFSLNNTGPKSAAKSVSYSCVELKAAKPLTPGVVSLPNIKVLPIVAIAYNPPRERENPNPGFSLLEKRVSLGPPPPIALVEQDMNRTIPAFRILNSTCPKNGDANVTLSFAIAVEAKGTNIHGFVGEGYFQPTYPYRGSPVYVKGGRVLDSRSGGVRAIQNLPIGYEWVYFDRQVKCSTDLVIEYKADPDNKLKESDESDNVLRFRISTIDP